MMSGVETLLSVVMLGGAIWALVFLLPRARREHSVFGIVCSLLTALAAFIGFLFIGIGTHSR
jgi:hypothetical protein